ncbi:MAG: M23 family metallopeptidase [bacterium]|nr:M23 family metallopeptidase [bacterium]
MPMLLALAILFLPLPRCAATPLPGPVVESFAPGSGLAGHWGVDFQAEAGSAATAALAGTVTFAGRVVDNLSVTVHHGGGIRTSYSFLESIDVAVGDTVRQGERVGSTGRAHGSDSLHFSLRLGDRYLDPVGLFGCRAIPGPALRLVSETGGRPLYAVLRAARNPGRNLRSISHRPSDGRRGGAAFARTRRDHLHYRR